MSPTRPNLSVQARQVMLARALACHRAGALDEAEKLYRTALAAQPDDFDALHYLGVLERQRGRAEEALHLIGRALEVKPDSPEAHSNLGNALQSAGRPLEAVASYDRALALRPDYVVALNNRGNALQSAGRHAEAVASYERALAVNPGLADALNNRGTALAALDRLQEALESYDRALALKPDYADAHANRGAALEALKRPEEALESYDRALALQADHAIALNNRANALRALARHDEALASYDRALALRPEYADALHNRGNVLLALNRPEAALESYERALAAAPAHAGALHHKGDALQALDRHEQALACYDQALKLAPGDPEVLCSRGVALEALRRPGDALAAYEHALATRPDFVAALRNRGNALQSLGRNAEAIASYDRALQIQPDEAGALGERGAALQALGRHEEAAAAYVRLLAVDPDLPDAAGMLLHEKMYCCDWGGHEQDVARVVEAVRAGKRSATPFCFVTFSTSPPDQRLCAEQTARSRWPAAAHPLCEGASYAHDRIRVAYLSSDLREHAVGVLVAGLAERHDRTRFDTVAISLRADASSPVQARLRRAFGRFVDAHERSDRDVAALLRAMEIDIAVDLNGYTRDARPGIFALRPAPIQVNYLGYPGTMGSEYHDYIIADRIIIPDAHRAHYTEQVVWLPDTYQVNDDTRTMVEALASRGQAGLPQDGFVFCSFNNSFKITPQLFALWMRLLRRVPGSVLWLQHGSAAVERNLRREADAAGVAPDRLVFAPWAARLEDHLARYRLADLFLDTLPFNAHATASDALWAGVPVLTCLGTTFAGRVAASLLHAIGLPELVTDSLAQYEARAVELAEDAAALAALKRRLQDRRQTAALFDTGRFCRHLEAAYVSMWERQRQGAPAAGFAVAPIDP
jgi:predicted O-linked N-acetylglucosamine transferase (SPINDLY family)